VEGGGQKSAINVPPVACGRRGGGVAELIGGCLGPSSGPGEDFSVPAGVGKGGRRLSRYP